MRVAFLGLGRMGSAMAAHVLAAGHELTVWNRTPGRAGELVAAGAREAAGAGEAAAGQDAVVLMLFGPDSVRETLAEVVASAAPGTLVIDSTTISPQAAREFGTAAGEAGLRYLDAPVAGSVAPATDGTLGVFVGGSEADYADAEPLLHLWGDPAKVRRVGEVGTASALKLCVNLALGVSISGLGEALRLGRDLGLDRDDVLAGLSAGPFGWTLAQKRAMLADGDFSATTFSVDLLAKDLELAVDAADADLRLTRAALEAARSTVAAGHSGDDYAAVAGHLADEGEADSH